MDWEWISYYCENIFAEVEEKDGTIIDENYENGWGWYIFI